MQPGGRALTVFFAVAALATGCTSPGIGGSSGGAPSSRPEPPRDASPEPPRGARPKPPESARSPFPTPEALEELGDSPEPVEIFSLDVHPVDEWTLAGPFPEKVGALPATDPGP